MSDLHVIVLAAGQGTRMRSALPKVLHRLAGRPMLEHVLETAARLSPERLHIVHGHGGALVRDRVTIPEGLSVTWVEQPAQLGTGHAVQQAMPQVPDTARVLVLYGDVPLVEAATLRHASERAAEGALSLVTVMLDDATGYGRVVRDAQGTVVGVVEEKDAGPEQLRLREGNTGILAAGARRLRGWLDRLDNDNAQGEFYLTDVVAMAVVDRVDVDAVRAADAEAVMGINDRIQLAYLERRFQAREAERLMRAGATLADPRRLDVRGRVEIGQDVEIDVNVILEGHVVLGDGVRIGANCYLADCHVGRDAEILHSSLLDGAEVGAGSRIGPFARLRPGTRLGEATRVGNFVEVKNTVLGARSKANHLSYLGDSEIGCDTNVGAGTITCNYDGANKHRTLIGDRVFIGSGVELVAPIVIGDDATVGAGSTVSKDAPAGQLTLERARQTTLTGWKRPTKKR